MSDEERYQDEEGNDAQNNGAMDDVVDLDEPQVLFLMVGERKLSAEFPPGSDRDFQAEIDKLVNSRFKQRGQRVINTLSEAGKRFFDRTCRRVWPVRIGGQVYRESDALPSHWQDAVRPDIKTAFAMAFQEKEVSVEEDMRRD